MHFDKEDGMGALTSLLWVAVYPIFGLVYVTRGFLIGLYAGLSRGIAFLVAAPTARRVWASKIHVPLGERTADCNTSCSCSCMWGLAIVYWIGLVVGNLCAVLHSTAPTHGVDFPSSYWAWNGYQSYEWILLGLAATNIFSVLAEIGRASGVRFFEEHARRREQECIAAAKAAGGRLRQGLGAERIDDDAREHKRTGYPWIVVGIVSVVPILMLIFPFVHGGIIPDRKHEREVKAAISLEQPESVTIAGLHRYSATLIELRHYIGRRVQWNNDENYVIVLGDKADEPRVLCVLWLKPTHYWLLKNDVFYSERLTTLWLISTLVKRDELESAQKEPNPTTSPETPAVPATKKQVY